MKNKKGFTLIEILAVVIILGLITTIAMVSITRYQNKALERELISIRSSIKSSFSNYRITSVVSKEEQLSLNNLKFDKNITYNKKNCSLENSYVYYIIRGDKGIKYTTTDENFNTTNEQNTSIAEEYCVHLECNNEVVIDDATNEESICSLPDAN